MSDIKEIWKCRFCDKLSKKECKSNPLRFDNDKVKSLMKKVDSTKADRKKQLEDYESARHYDVSIIRCVEKFIVPVTENDPQVNTTDPQMNITDRLEICLTFCMIFV